MQIEVLSVKVATVPTKTGSYQSAEVAFKNLTFGGKVEGKKVMSFGATGPSFKALAMAQMGEVYEVEVVKNTAGYNDWVSATKQAAGAEAATPASSGKPASAGSTYTATPKSTYETPEERAKKQIYIVRQSSISNAVDLLSVGAKTAPDVDKVISVAKEFEAFVFGSDAVVEAPGGISGFDDLDDVPL